VKAPPPDVLPREIVLAGQQERTNQRFLEAISRITAPPAVRSTVTDRIAATIAANQNALGNPFATGAPGVPAVSWSDPSGTFGHGQVLGLSGPRDAVAHAAAQGAVHSQFDFDMTYERARRFVEEWQFPFWITPGSYDSAIRWAQAQAASFFPDTGFRLFYSNIAAMLISKQSVARGGTAFD
jgi:hypothetical protein